ncbi:MAG: helix-turn-helix domain-containing protein [Gaiellaceae bacterium]
MVLPIFRSNAQASVLATLFLAADERGLSLREVARRSRVAQSQAHREVTRLEEAGIVVSERVGKTRLVRPNPASPFREELAALVVKAFGPVPVLREQLGAVPGVEEAYIFGSWAVRLSGQPGPPPQDIDVLVIGEPELDLVYRAASEAERPLGRAVNPTLVSPGEWERAESGFLRTVKARPLVPLLPGDR